MDFLKFATTLKVLGHFSISIKHLAFGSLILRLFGKISGIIFCSFFAYIRFFVTEKLCILVQITSQHQLFPFSNHSHKKRKDSLETRDELADLRIYVENQAILEPILLYRGSKCKQIKEQGSENCLWTVYVYF